MYEFLKNLKKYSLITIVVTAVLGILLLAFPEKMVEYTALIIGCGIILCGLYAVISYIIKRDNTFLLVLGIIAIIFGIVICAAYQKIVSFMIIIMGILLIAGGVMDLMNSIQVAIRKHRSWILTIIMSVASIVFGVLAIVNPFETQTTIIQLIGVGFILFAVLEIISYIQVKFVSDKVKEKVESADTASDDYNDDDYNEVDDN